MRSIRPFCVPLPTIFAPTADFGSIKGALPPANAALRSVVVAPAEKSSCAVVGTIAEQLCLPGTTLRLAGLDVVGLLSPPTADAAAAVEEEKRAAESDDDDSNYLHTLDDIEAVITDDVHYQKTNDAFDADQEDQQLVIVVDEERHTTGTVALDDDEQTAADAICGYNDVCGRTCRLCAQVFDNDEALIRIFDQCNDGLADDVTMLLPNMVGYLLDVTLWCLLMYTGIYTLTDRRNRRPAAADLHRMLHENRQLCAHDPGISRRAGAALQRHIERTMMIWKVFINSHLIVFQLLTNKTLHDYFRTSENW